MLAFALPSLVPSSGGLDTGLARRNRNQRGGIGQDARSPQLVDERGPVHLHT
jgi:hypothetical protein